MVMQVEEKHNKKYVDCFGTAPTCRSDQNGGLVAGVRHWFVSGIEDGEELAKRE
jgi:hypothetical protein